MRNRPGNTAVSGIDVIDQQHEEIVRRLGVFKDLHSEDKAEAAANALDELITYAKGHFEFEELLIEASEYEFCKTHRKLHELFVTRLTKYQVAHRNGQVKPTEIYNFLRAWFGRHMSQDDFNYVLAAKNRIDELLADRDEDGWYMRTLRQCFPQGGEHECTQ